MRRNNSRARLIFSAAATVIATFVPTVARAACSPPLFTVVRDFTNPRDGHGSLYVQISPATLTVQNLVCTSQVLREQHPEWSNIVALFFTSFDAAELFDAAPMSDSIEVDPTGRVIRNVSASRFRNELRGLYILDVERGDNYLSLTPIGIDGGDVYNTKIELSKANATRCRMEMDGRCVLALKPFGFPEETLVNGKKDVALSGTVSRGGYLGIKVDSVDGRPPSPEDAFAKSAYDNLTTWWLEPRSQTGTFRIVYSYVLDSTLAPGQVSVKLALPDRVTISGPPRHQ